MDPAGEGVFGLEVRVWTLDGNGRPFKSFQKSRISFSFPIKQKKLPDFRTPGGARRSCPCVRPGQEGRG